MSSVEESSSDISSDPEDIDEDEEASDSESPSENSEKTTSKSPSKHLLTKRIEGTRTKNMSLGDLIKVRDRIGTKKFNSEVLAARSKERSKTSFKRENKNRPQEISSKIKVPAIREIIPIPKSQKETRDPRFDNLCGSEYDEELFDKRFTFLPRIREREKKILQKQMRKSKSSDDQKNLKYLLTRMKQQDLAKMKRQEAKECEREWKREERKKVEQGIKKPFFLKNSEKKKLLMEMRQKKLEELGQGAVKKREARLEKRKKTKESKSMPWQRRTITLQLK